MIRPRFIKAALVALAIVVVLAGLAVNFNTVSVTTASITLPVVISRNGREASSEQIRRVSYLFSSQSTQPVQKIKADRLREAVALHDNTGKSVMWNVSVRSRVERAGMARFSSAKVVPDYYHSVFLRAEFVDGKVFSASFPVTMDHRSEGAVYLDFDDANPQSPSE